MFVIFSVRNFASVMALAALVMVGCADERRDHPVFLDDLNDVERFPSDDRQQLKAEHDKLPRGAVVRVPVDGEGNPLTGARAEVRHFDRGLDFQKLSGERMASVWSEGRKSSRARLAHNLRHIGEDHKYGRKHSTQHDLDDHRYGHYRGYRHGYKHGRYHGGYRYGYKGYKRGYRHGYKRGYRGYQYGYNNRPLIYSNYTYPTYSYPTNYWYNYYRPYYRSYYYPNTWWGNYRFYNTYYQPNSYRYFVYSPNNYCLTFTTYCY